MRRLRCFFVGCRWGWAPGADAKTCSRCGARMTAHDVIWYWRAETAIPSAIVYAATGRRLSDQTLLTHKNYGWPYFAPKRFRCSGQ